MPVWTWRRSEKSVSLLETRTPVVKPVFKSFYCGSVMIHTQNNFRRRDKYFCTSIRTQIKTPKRRIVLSHYIFSTFPLGLLPEYRSAEACSNAKNKRPGNLTGFRFSPAVFMHSIRHFKIIQGHFFKHRSSMTMLDRCSLN